MVEKIRTAYSYTDIGICIGVCRSEDILILVVFCRLRYTQSDLRYTPASTNFAGASGEMCFLGNVADCV